MFDRPALLADYFQFLMSEVSPVFDELKALGHEPGSPILDRGRERVALLKAGPLPSVRALAVMTAAGVRP